MTSARTAKRPTYISAAEVADQLGISVRSAYDLLKTEKLATWRFGASGKNGLRTTQEELDRFIAERAEQHS